MRRTFAVWQIAGPLSVLIAGMLGLAVQHVALLAVVLDRAVDIEVVADDVAAVRHLRLLARDHWNYYNFFLFLELRYFSVEIYECEDVIDLMHLSIMYRKKLRFANELAGFAFKVQNYIKKKLQRLIAISNDAQTL